MIMFPFPNAHFTMDQKPFFSSASHHETINISYNPLISSSSSFFPLFSPNFTFYQESSSFQLTEAHAPIPPALASPTDHHMETATAASLLLAADKSAFKRPIRRDRHSKIFTAQGLRDRRMRLSLAVARQFFDLQDMLGFDKASKTIQWLLDASKGAIEGVVADSRPEALSLSGGGSVSSESTEASALGLDSVDGISAVSAHNKGKLLANEQDNRLIRPPAFAKELRAKARERARERTREKKIKMLQFDGRLQNGCSDQWNESQLPSYSFPFETYIEEESGSQDLVAIVDEERRSSLRHQCKQLPMAAAIAPGVSLDDNVNLYQEHWDIHELLEEHWEV